MKKKEKHWSLIKAHYKIYIYKTIWKVINFQRYTKLNGTQKEIKLPQEILREMTHISSKFTLFVHHSHQSTHYTSQ